MKLETALGVGVGGVLRKTKKSEEASEKVTFEQRQEEGKEVSSAYI